MKRIRIGFPAAAFFVLALAAAPAQARRIYVRVAPRVAVVETRGVAPSRRHVWIAGFNRWNGRAYVRVPGRWALRPRLHAVWAPGHWRHTRYGWYWIPGRWR
jgi:hypothetical protein